MKSRSGESIVLTGCGWVTPFAAGTIDEVLAAASSAAPAPSKGLDYWAVPDEWLDDHPGLPREIRGDKGSWVTAAALEQAFQRASVARDALSPERLGLVLGCGLAGQLGMIGFANEVREQTPRFVSPIHFPQTVGNYIAGAVARGYGIRGPNVTLAGGCASGLDAIIEGRVLIANGNADVVVAGGTDVLSQNLALGLAEPGAVLSEGACLFVLERAERAEARGVVPLALIAGAARPHADRPRLPAPDAAILSSPCIRHRGAIFVEHWTGRCPGASGAAAVAAAIGAAHGCQVPLVEESDPGSVVITRLAADDLPATNGMVSAVVFTDRDGPDRTMLEIRVPRTVGSRPQRVEKG